MRFSTRWLLAVTAYVALAPTAIATGSYLLADLTWAVSLLALGFAVVVACVGRQQRQAIALGFVTLATANLVGLYLVPDRVPAMRLFSAAGYIVYSTGKIYEPDPTAPPAQGAYREVRGIVPTSRTVNAIGTLVVGLIGCLVGKMACRFAAAHGGGHGHRSVPQ